MIKILNELFDKNNEFRKRYFDNIKFRLALSSLSLENLDKDSLNSLESIQIDNQLQAIEYIFNLKACKEYNYIEFNNILCDLIKKVTNGEYSEFRKTNAIVNGSKVERTSPELIINHLYYLINDYNYWVTCSEIDDFEREAMFHIRLLHIHPFEDGNGRIARIILTYNLSKFNHAPCIINQEDKKRYCQYIEESNTYELAKLFKECSEKEMANMIALYNKMNDEGLIEYNNFSEIEQAKYDNIINERNK